MCQLGKCSNSRISPHVLFSLFFIVVECVKISFFLLLGSFLSVSCASAHVQCKSFTVLRIRFPFAFVLCHSWPVFRATEVCSQGLTADSDGLYGIVSVTVPDDWWAAPLQWVCKRALISLLNLLQEILSVSFLNELKAAFNISLAFLQKRGSCSWVDISEKRLKCGFSAQALWCQNVICPPALLGLAFSRTAGKARGNSPFSCVVSLCSDRFPKLVLVINNEILFMVIMVVGYYQLIQYFCCSYRLIVCYRPVMSLHLFCWFPKPPI